MFLQHQHNVLYKQGCGVEGKISDSDSNSDLSKISDSDSPLRTFQIFRLRLLTPTP